MQPPLKYYVEIIKAFNLIRTERASLKELLIYFRKQENNLRKKIRNIGENILPRKLNPKILSLFLY